MMSRIIVLVVIGIFVLALLALAAQSCANEEDSQPEVTKEESRPQDIQPVEETVEKTTAYPLPSTGGIRL